MDMLQTLKDEVKTRFQTEAEVEAFMAGFEKQAALEKQAEPYVFNHEMAKAGLKVGATLIGSLLGAGAVAGIAKGFGSHDNNQLRSKFEMALQQVVNTNKIVKNANPTKVRSYADTLFSFAPHVSSDPNLLSSLLANAVLGEGIDPMTIKSITDLEGRYKENNSYTSLPSFKV